MSNPVEILTTERQEFSIGSQLAAYLRTLTTRAPGVLLFRTGAGRIYRDLLIHWPTLEEWEDEAQELCQRIADAIYPLAGALYAQAVELSVIIAFAPVTPPERVDALSTYVVFDANTGTEAHYYLSPQHPLPPYEQLSITRGVIVLGRPLHYSYHTIKDDRRKIDHPRAGLYELSQRLINEMYEQPLFIPRDRAVLSKVKAQIKALPKEVERAEISRNANLATPTRHLAYAAPRIAAVTSLSALPPPVRALERRLMVHVMDKSLSPELRLQLRRAAQTIRGHFPQVMIEEAGHRETRPTAIASPRALATPQRQPVIAAQPALKIPLSGIKEPPRSSPASLPIITRQAVPYAPPVITTRFVPSTVPLSVPPTVVVPALQRGLKMAAQPSALRTSFTPTPLSAAPTSGIVFSTPRPAAAPNVATPQAKPRQVFAAQPDARPTIQNPPVQRASPAPTSPPRTPRAADQTRAEQWEQPLAQESQPTTVPRSYEPARPSARAAQQSAPESSPARQPVTQTARATPAQPTERPIRTASAAPESPHESQPSAQPPRPEAQQELRLNVRQESKPSPRDAKPEPRSDLHLGKKIDINVAPTIHKVAGMDIRQPGFYDQIRAPIQTRNFSLRKDFAPRTEPTLPKIFPRAESVGRLNAATHTATTSVAPKATPATHVAWNFPTPFLGLMPHSPKTRGKK